VRRTRCEWVAYGGYINIGCTLSLSGGAKAPPASPTRIRTMQRQHSLVAYKGITSLRGFVAIDSRYVSEQIRNT